MSKLLISKYSIYLFLLLNDHYIGSKVPWVSDKVDYILYFEKKETIDISVSWDETEIHHIEKKPEIVIPTNYVCTHLYR